MDGSAFALISRISDVENAPRSGNTIPAAAPRSTCVWSYLLPRSTRARVFEPAYQDLLRDFAEARQFKGKWQRRWLTFCFAFQTALMVIDCLRALILDRFAFLLPEHLRRWLSGPK
jgi:hypothetical protein